MPSLSDLQQELVGLQHRLRDMKPGPERMRAENRIAQLTAQVKRQVQKQ